MAHLKNYRKTGPVVRYERRGCYTLYCFFFSHYIVVTDCRRQKINEKEAVVDAYNLFCKFSFVLNTNANKFSLSTNANVPIGSKVRMSTRELQNTSIFCTQAISTDVNRPYHRLPYKLPNLAQPLYVQWVPTTKVKDRKLSMRTKTIEQERHREPMNYLLPIIQVQPTTYYLDTFYLCTTTYRYFY